MRARLADGTDPRLLAAALRDTDGRLFVSVEGDEVVFSGGRWGEHSIVASVSCSDRVRAHFEGYCEANDTTAKEFETERVTGLTRKGVDLVLNFARDIEAENRLSYGRSWVEGHPEDLAAIGIQVADQAGTYCYDVAYRSNGSFEFAFRAARRTVEAVLERLGTEVDVEWGY